MRHRSWLALIVAALLPACAKVEAPALPRVEAPLAIAEPAPDGRRFAVVPGLSEVRILVYRAGPLAAFGHNHVVNASVRGEIHLAPDFGRSVFALSLPVADFDVDPPRARAAEGGAFAAPLSAEAVAQTRNNMLGPAVLDATNHPEIRIRSVRVAGADRAPELTLRIALRGAERDLVVPATLEARGGELTAAGTFSLSQRDFGIEPFSILGGGLQVADALTIRFRIVAASTEP